MESIAPHTASLQISLFGTFAVTIDGQPMRKLRTRTGNWLVALLTLQRGEPAEREWLARTLWPESAPAVANDNLRHCLTDLRKALGPAATRLSSPSRTTVRLDLEGVRVDLFDFEAAMESGDADEVQRAAGVYQQPFLRGCEAAWADAERERLAIRYRAGIERIAAEARANGSLTVAVEYYRRLLSLDPLQEELTSTLMDVLVELGDLDGAIDLYRNFRSRLARVLNTVPDQDTINRYRSILSASRKQARSTTSTIEAADTRPAAVPRTSSLPAPHKRLLGRDQAILDILACLDSARLVTLTGTGGIGKTSLAIHVAAVASPDYGGAAWFVDLSAVTSAAEIGSEIESTLDLGRGSSGGEETILDALSDRNALLVLDNCEHLLPACAHVVRRLLDRCPAIRILATSRQPLGLTGEWQWRVPPLALPPAALMPSLLRNGDSDVAALLSHSAVEMFVSEAIRARRDFEVTADSAACIARICGKLDGLPLAIELAAAWARTLPVQEIDRRLKDPFQLLQGRDCTGPERHRTLGALLDWSFALLMEDERRLWRELSVYNGGWTLDAMEAVCTPSSAQRSLVWLLDRLVEMSIALYEERNGEARYHLPETLRQYASAKLSSDAARQLSARHLAYYLDWAETAATHLVGADQAAWLDRLAQERGNLRKALETARDNRMGDQGLRLAAALWRYWHARGDCETGQTWIETFLDIGNDAAPHLRLKAVGAAGNLAYRRADYASARRHFEAHLALSRQLDLPRGVASALGNLGNVATDDCNDAEARAYFEESLEAFRHLNDDRGIALTLGNLAIVVGRMGDFRLAQQYHASSIAIFRASGDLMNLSMALANLAETLLRAARYTSMVAPLVESLRISYQLGSLRSAGRCLLLALSLAIALSEDEIGALLVGTLERLKSHAELPLQQSAWDRYERDRISLIKRLGDQDFVRTVDRGHALREEEIVALLGRMGA